VRTAFITRNIIQLVFETLKQHYPVKPLNEILDLSNGKSMTKASMSADGSIPVYGANGVIGLTHKALTLEQTITIGRVGSCGEVNLTSGQAWISDNAMWVSRIVEGIDRDYLYFALKSLPLAVSAKIAAMPSISQTNVFRESIPCPSIREQLQVAAFLKDFCQGKNVDNCAALPPFLLKLRRIVAQVEELAGKIEEARSLRQQAADEANLFSKAFIDKVYASSFAQFGSTRLEKVCLTITDGDHQTPAFADKGIKFVFVGNVSSSYLHFDGCKYVTPEYYASIKLHRKPRKGDILYSAVGATLGIPAIVDSDDEFCFQRHVAIIKPDPNKLLSKFIWYMLKSRTLYSKAWQGTTGSAQPTVPLRAIRALPIPVPPLLEQHRIVAYLDNLQSKVDEMKRLREGAMKEFNALLPSILDKAFKGEL
jgi:type I restriction enzyme S subunit